MISPRRLRLCTPASEGVRNKGKKRLECVSRQLQNTGRPRGLGLFGQKRQRLQACNLEWLTAAYVDARQFIVASYHVRLRLGKARPIPLVGPARQLRPLAPNHPGHLVLPCLPALGTDQGMRALLRRFVEKIPLFHDFLLLRSSTSEESIPYSPLA